MRHSVATKEDTVCYGKKVVDRPVRNEWGSPKTWGWDAESRMYTVPRYQALFLSFFYYSKPDQT